MFGRVIEVNSGDTITILNLNRPVRVRLLGVDAPELDQAFGDVAKKHLADLVYDKSVLVEYAGIAADKSLTGRVLLDSADIGAQMIRDGVAWVDPGTQHRLNDTDREVYQQSELAARSERRGLWQQENPIAPWEFVKAAALRKYSGPTLKNASEPAITVKRSGLLPELTNLTLMTAKMNTGSMRPQPKALKRQIIDDAELPSGLPFTVFLPRKRGTRVIESVAVGADIFDVNGYFFFEGSNLYSLTWITSQTHGEDDKTALSEIVFEDVLKGTAGAFSGGDPQARCSPVSESEISSSGYFGSELDLSLCQIPSRIRAFTKVTGDRREMYIAMVSFKEDDANVTHFLKSFVMDRKKAQK